MSNKTNDLDMIPAIKPAKDEVRSYQRGSSRDAPKQSNFNGMLVFVLIFMAILMGVGGYTLYEVQQQLAVSNDLLQKAGDERTRLEEDLAVSGVRSSNSFKQMMDRQENNAAEIRKLWVISHQQNKPKIDQLSASLKRINSSSTKLTAGITQINQAFKALSSDMVEVRQDLIDDNSEAATQLSIIRGQVQDQSDVVEKNNRNLSSVTQKIKALEEDIETFDRYRQQTNKKILDLQRQVRNVGAGVATGG